MEANETELNLGIWLACMLNDPAVCDEMKDDIIEWMQWIELRLAVNEGGLLC